MSKLYELTYEGPTQRFEDSQSGIAWLQGETRCASEEVKARIEQARAEMGEDFAHFTVAPHGGRAVPGELIALHGEEPPEPAPLPEGPSFEEAKRLVNEKQARQKGLETAAVSEGAAAETSEQEEKEG